MVWWFPCHFINLKILGSTLDSFNFGARIVSSHRAHKFSKIFGDGPALIFNGCKLVKNLEDTLPNISNQPHFLITSCDEISRVFGNVREHLNLPPQDYGHHEPPHAMDMVLHEQLSLHQHHGMEAIASQELGGGQNAETDVAHSSLKQTRKR
ncbi:hypothetical protein Hanom_Chr14g01330331 [Helianthus anomalus]